MFTLSECFDDKGERNKAEKYYVEFLKAGEYSPIAFEASEEPFDLVTLFVKSAVILPGIDAIGFWRHHGNHAQIEDQLPGFITFLGAIHQQRQAFRHRPSSRSSSRPSGASWALPGESAKVMAVRAFAATR